MKWFKRIAYGAVGFFVLLNVIVAFHAWQFTHFYPDAPQVDLKSLNFLGKANVLFFGYQFPKSKVETRPEVPFETVSLTTKGGLNIYGWLIKNDTTQKAVILFHGHGGQKGALLEQAAFMNGLGYSTLLVDFRAHGESDGTTCTVGYSEAEEVALSYQFMKAKGYEQIALYGTSMGAAAIIKAVNQDQLKPYKLILEMPFGSLPDAVKGRLRLLGLPESPFGELLTFWGGVEHGYWAFNFSPCADAVALTMPVLLQWGDKDVRVQEREIQCIFNNLPGQKQLVVFKNAGHQSLYTYDTATWMTNVRQFLNK